LRRFAFKRLFTYCTIHFNFCSLIQSKTFSGTTFTQRIYIWIYKEFRFTNWTNLIHVSNYSTGNPISQPYLAQRKD
jgi:hypothetical protein